MDRSNPKQLINKSNSSIAITSNPLTDNKTSKIDQKAWNKSITNEYKQQPGQLHHHDRYDFQSYYPETSQSAVIQQNYHLQDPQDFSCLEGYRVIDLAKYLPHHDPGFYQNYQYKQSNQMNHCNQHYYNPQVNQNIIYPHAAQATNQVDLYGTFQLQNQCFSSGGSVQKNFTNQQFNFDSTVYLMNNGEAVSVREFSLFSWDFYKEFQLGNPHINEYHYDFNSHQFSFDNLKKFYSEEEKRKLFWQFFSLSNNAKKLDQSADTNSTRIISPIDETSTLYPNLNLSEALKINDKKLKSEENPKIYKPIPQRPLPLLSNFDYSLSILRMPNSAPVEVTRHKKFPVKLIGNISNARKTSFYTLDDILPIIGHLKLTNTTSEPKNGSQQLQKDNRKTHHSQSENLNDPNEFTLDLQEFLQFLYPPQNNRINYRTLKWERQLRPSSPKKIEDYSHLEIENKKQRYPIKNLFSGPVLDYLKKFIQKQRDEINSIPETVLHYPLEFRAAPITLPNGILNLEDKIDHDEEDRNTYAFLYGIPKTETNENIGAIVGRAFAIAMVDIQTCLKIRRFPCNTINPQQPQMISLQFTTRQTRTNFVWQFNNKKVTVNDFQWVLNLRKIPYEMTAENVFARESLTARNRELFDKAKTLKHLKLIENAFTYDGIVYVFINTWTTSLRINNLIELELAVMQQQKEKRLLRYNWLEHWRRSGLLRDEFYDWVRRRDRIYLDLMMF